LALFGIFESGRIEYLAAVPIKMGNSCFHAAGASPAGGFPVGGAPEAVPRFSSPVRKCASCAVFLDSVFSLWRARHKHYGAFHGSGPESVSKVKEKGNTVLFFSVVGMGRAFGRCVFLVSGMVPIRMVEAVSVPYVHSVVALLHSGDQRAQLSPQRTLPHAGQASVFPDAFSVECCFLVVF